MQSQQPNKRISFSFLDQFSIECKNPDTIETVLRNRQTSQLVLMKEINISEDDYEETLSTLYHQRQLLHEQLVSILEFYPQPQSSTFLVLYEYCSISLAQEFEERLN